MQMTRAYLLISSVFIMGLFIRCNVYKSANKYIGKKMDKSEMQLYTDQVGDVSVQYWDNKAEDKPVMVLVHGFGANTRFQWFRQIEELSEHYRVLMPNLMYFGKTKPENPRYTVADQVDLVNDFIKHLGVEKYSICGVSYGGLITCEMGRRYPEGIEKMVVFDAPVKYMYKQDIDSTQSLFDVPSIEELFVPSDVKGLKKLMYLATMKKSVLPSSWMEEFYLELYAYEQDHKRQLMTSMIAGLDEYQQFEYQFSWPTLLIWGSNDPIVPVNRGHKLHQHLGEGTEMVVIKKGAHMPNLTKHKKFNKALLDFLLD